MKELFLGDLHTDSTKQKQYRPTAYQYPLRSKDCIKSSIHDHIYKQSFQNIAEMKYFDKIALNRIQ
ncbi:hypothetical protein Anas_06994 [Armadillidium nasatum]|uniref:APCDD1 domain-containing protein n=1 Tax=Armadillidium nasatum TaxID=96803 RepID=A0A5N5T7N1_9CRUS|nr:hypothetical protein Anas_06994 [Armadillidium nasatum]